MRRLRDQLGSHDPAVAKLACLIVAINKLDPSPGTQDRVWRAIAGRQWMRPSWRRRVVLVLLFLVGVPAAVVGMNRFVRLWSQPASDKQKPPTERSTSLLQAPAVQASVLSEQIPPLRDALPMSAEDLQLSARSHVPPATIPAAPASVTRHESVRPPETTGAPENTIPIEVTGDSTRTGPDPLPPARSAPLPSPVPPLSTTTEVAPRAEVVQAKSEEAALVLGAVRALRRDHDVSAAVRLLEAYRLRFPSGDLAEEALALTIEALAMRGDRAALDFVDEYLRRFRKGRFVDRVRQTQRFFGIAR
jgi:hypothetical protein